MSEIALYNALTKLGLDHDEAKEAVADVANSKDVATRSDIKDMATKSDIKDMATKSDIAEMKADITELKADVTAVKWMLGLLLAINVAFIVSAVSLLVRFV